MQYIQSNSGFSKSGERVLITGGTDMRIRVWDVNQPEKSYVMSDGLRNHVISRGSSRGAFSGNNTFKYSSKIVDAVQVLSEDENTSPSRSSSSSLITEPNAVSTAHHDSITDLLWIDSVNVLISTDKEGVVKLWK
jgi:hypothetical protein